MKLPKKRRPESGSTQLDAEPIDMPIVPAHGRTQIKSAFKSGRSKQGVGHLHRMGASDASRGVSTTRGRPCLVMITCSPRAVTASTFAACKRNALLAAYTYIRLRVSPVCENYVAEGPAVRARANHGTPPTTRCRGSCSARKQNAPGPVINALCSRDAGQNMHGVFPPRLREPPSLRSARTALAASGTPGVHPGSAGDCRRKSGTGARSPSCSCASLHLPRVASEGTFPFKVRPCWAYTKKREPKLPFLLSNLS